MSWKKKKEPFPDDEEEKKKPFLLDSREKERGSSLALVLQPACPKATRKKEGIDPNASSVYHSGGQEWYLPTSILIAVGPLGGGEKKKKEGGRRRLSSPSLSGKKKKKKKRREKGKTWRPLLSYTSCKVTGRKRGGRRRKKEGASD